MVIQLVMFKILVCGCFFTVLLGLMLWGLDEICKFKHIYLPTRVQVYGESLFLALPRYGTEPGQGFSLARTSSRGLQPFPNRKVHSSGLILNAVDLQLDSRGTLWVLDSGFFNTLKNPIKKHGVRVLGIDADSGRIEAITEFGELVPGRAQFLSVEEAKNGTRFLYVSDGPARSIAVWDLKAQKGHRVLLPERVAPKSKHPKILYTVLIGKKLYFTYFGSKELFFINSWGLRKGGKIVHVGRKDPRMVFLGSAAYDIVFRLAGRPEILCWDTREPLDSDHINIADKGNNESSPMAAVPNYGVVWVLESDVKSFLDGKQPVNIFRPLNKTVDQPPYKL